jgi:hypothetical protein
VTKTIPGPNAPYRGAPASEASPAAAVPEPENHPCPVAAQRSGNTAPTAAYPPGTTTAWAHASNTPRMTIRTGEATSP